MTSLKILCIGLLLYSACLHTVVKWCKKNDLPLVKIGKKTYTHADQVDGLIAGKLEKSGLASNLNVKCESKVAKTESMLPGNTPSIIQAKTKTAKCQRSKAAEDYIKNIKAA